MSFLSRLIGPRVRCDHCGRTYKPNLTDKALPSGGAVRRFTCPHCGTVTIVAVITPRGVELQKRIQDLDLSDRGAREALARLRAELKAEVRRP